MKGSDVESSVTGLHGAMPTFSAWHLKGVSGPRAGTLREGVTYCFKGVITLLQGVTRQGVTGI